MTQFISNAIVFAAIALSLGYACWRLGPRETLRAQLRKYFPRYFPAPTVAANGCGGCTGCAAAALPRKAPGCGTQATQ